ncbi:MAG: MATE family efflux transporter [Nitrososphaerota archaeon]|nr:MATE family efflux transporter [Candidatus Bathyarchaeota archaeon]MDW8194430.1 MATE family efflux transporter [Nitrososphaerota archaeon]
MVDKTDGGLLEPHEISKYRDKIVNGPIIRTILWLGAPPLINQLVVVAYNLADTYWLSIYSEVAVAVPRQMWPVLVLFHAFINALTAACLSIISQYVGSKAYSKASLEASRFFSASILLGAAASTVLLAFREVIFGLVMSTPHEIFDLVMAYSGVIVFDTFFNYVALTYTTLLQSFGDTKRPALVNMVAVGVNIILDPFLVLGIGPFPRLGVVGAAFTDVLGKFLSIIGQAYILRRNYPELKVTFTRNINFEWARLVMRIGLPILALGLTNGFAFIIQLRLVNMLGIIAAAAFSIGFVIMDTVDAALWGLGGAPAIMIGQNLGAGKNKRAREIALKATALIFAIVTLVVFATYPFNRDIADIFANDPEILNEAELFLDILLPTLPFFGIFINAVSAGRGSGHTMFPTALGMVRLWILRLALGYLMAFPLQIGSLGIWLAIALSNIAGGAVALIWIRYGKWTKPIVKENIRK